MNTATESDRRNGKIDRWERYLKGALVRVDLDTNGNGKPDRWLTYEAGILMDTFLDANEDGQADDPPSQLGKPELGLTKPLIFP